ncbi:hypothetical protein HWC80_gp086 [Mycobacterium phage Indlulamithi]|uniref:Uncharacterized protein n=1 Tax=Mycobacterium phage Indlulamithi TaxID=2656582 RepID=A0A649VCU0_9CAUD|nr:hypothetical protein HWC80_gp086 [Mycobacterium phage Indlulamithi]QGJ90126.1 hypothetical protein PBI_INDLULAMITHI_88 [Mycobacterium phage Indlulamithi]
MSKHFTFVPDWSLPSFDLVKTWVKFKWEWAVFYEEWTRTAGHYRQKKIVCESRREARIFRDNLNVRVKYGDKIRNVVMKRRLIQVNWDEYHDSFSYNAKGNGNGR